MDLIRFVFFFINPIEIHRESMDFAERKSTQQDLRKQFVTARLIHECSERSVPAGTRREEIDNDTSAYRVIHYKVLACERYFPSNLIYLLNRISRATLLPRATRTDVALFFLFLNFFFFLDQVVRFTGEIRNYRARLRGEVYNLRRR